MKTLCEVPYEKVVLKELIKTGLYFELDADRQMVRILR